MVNKNFITNSSYLTQPKVLAKRQAQEARGLDAQFAAERRIAVEGALDKLHDKYNAKRDSMLQRHEKELADLAKEDLTSDQRQQRKAALLNKQQIELNKLERELADEKKGIEKGALNDWELRYARAKLQMKERHYQVHTMRIKFRNFKSVMENYTSCIFIFHEFLT